MSKRELNKEIMNQANICQRVMLVLASEGRMMDTTQISPFVQRGCLSIADLNWMYDQGFIGKNWRGRDSSRYYATKNTIRQLVNFGFWDYGMGIRQHNEPVPEVIRKSGISTRVLYTIKQLNDHGDGTKENRCTVQDVAKYFHPDDYNKVKTSILDLQKDGRLTRKKYSYDWYMYRISDHGEKYLDSILSPREGCVQPSEKQTQVEKEQQQQKPLEEMTEEEIREEQSKIRKRLEEYDVKLSEMQRERTELLELFNLHTDLINAKRTAGSALAKLATEQHRCKEIAAKIRAM